MNINKKKVSAKTPTKHGIDWILAGIIGILSAIGLLMVFNASVAEAYKLFGNNYHFLRLQVQWVGVGFVAMVAALLVPKEIWKKLAPILFILSVICLLLVLIPGLGSKLHGARRWLSLGPFSFQPSEVAKLSAVLYFSAWLSKHQRLEPFAFITGLLIALVMLQPDLGTTLVISSIAFALYFLSGAPVKTLLRIAIVGLIVGSILILGSSYRRERLMTFLDPTSDPQGSSYHINQVLIALGSGGITGQGIGFSRQKYHYLPEASTDSIFAVIAEETGFVGASLIVLLYIGFFYRGFKIALSLPDQFSQLLAGGIVSWISAQAFLNLMAMVVLVPLTGVPLPFISYGGSSLVTIFAGTGILLNLSQYTIASQKIGKRN